MHRVFIGVGSNISTRQAFILQAIAALQKLPHTQLKASSNWYINPPLGLKHQGAYINGVLFLKTALSATDLLKALKKIEKNIGRKQKRKRWGPRVIDLDILLFDTLTYKRKKLVIPHAQIWHRDFTLIPLRDLYPFIPNCWQKHYCSALEKLETNALKRTPMTGLALYTPR